jgi:hypothetical protein
MICRLRTYQAVEKNLSHSPFLRIRRPSLCSRVAQKLNMPSTGKKAFPQFLRSHCLLLQGGECYAPMGLHTHVSPLDILPLLSPSRANSFVRGAGILKCANRNNRANRC